MTYRVSIRRFIFALLVGVLLTTSAFAGTKDKRAKTEHVSGYKTKAGKKVAPYKRRPAN
jgi:hypothetical protein